MSPLPALFALLLALPAAAQDLGWSEATVNAGYDNVKAANAKGLGVSVDVRVWVVKGAVSAAPETVGFQLIQANNAYNSEEKDSVNVGVRFKFVGPALSIDLPKEFHDLKSVSRVKDKGQAYYGEAGRLSPAELRIFELMKKTNSGEINIVYIPGLGGGRGYTYQAKFRPRKNTEQELGGMSPEDFSKTFKNTILLSDTAGPLTLAHELGHVLTNSGHSTACDEEEAKIKRNRAACELAERNLMLPDGGYGTLLTDGQKAVIASFLRGKKLDR
jgi:hypothetical protein